MAYITNILDLDSGASVRTKLNVLVDFYNKMAVSDTHFNLLRIDPLYIQAPSPIGYFLRDDGSFAEVGKLGLIKIIDLEGTFFTDLPTAITYIEQFFVDPTIITNKSFDNGVFYFTVPPNTIMDATGTPFLNDYPNFTDVSFIDECGLITEFQEPYSFFLTRGKMYFVNAKFAGNCFQESQSNIDINNISLMSGVGDIGLYASGTIKIRGNIGSSEAIEYSIFFTNGTATILANASKYTSNSGGINGTLANAIVNGVNVFFNGIDKENVKNKAVDFTVIDNETYPTTQAVNDLFESGKFSYCDGTVGVLSVTNVLTISQYVLIPANTFTNGQNQSIEIQGKARKINNNSFAFQYLTINTSLSTSGQIILGGVTTSGNNTFDYLGSTRVIPIQSTPFYCNTLVTATGGDDNGVVSSAADITIDWTVDQYIMNVVRANVATDSIEGTFLRVSRK